MTQQVKFGTINRRCKKVRDARWFKKLILLTILLASLLVGLQTYDKLLQNYFSFFEFTDALILAIFFAEIIIKVLAEGNRPFNYFTDGWNVFDFLIVVICFVPTESMEFAPVLRLFRIMRVLRLFSALPKLQVLVTALIRSLPSMVYIVVMMSILFYVYAAVGTVLFRANDPIHFGTLGQSAVTLFTSVTLEDWPDIMYTQFYGSGFYGYNSSDMLIVMNKLGLQRTHTPQPITAVIYFGSFILIGAMVFINLFVGVILSGITDVKKELEKDLLFKLRMKQGRTVYEEVIGVSEIMDELREQLSVIQMRLKEEENKEKED